MNRIDHDTEVPDRRFFDKIATRYEIDGVVLYGS